MDDFPLERDGIARENLGNETIYQLMLFVNVRVVLNEHPGDHYRPASDARKITSSFQVELRTPAMPAMSCRAISGRGRTLGNFQTGVGFRQIGLAIWIHH